MSRALITGGAGFIGSHLSEALLEQGWTVEVVDDLSTGSIENISHLKGHPHFAYTLDSVMNRSLMLELVDRADVIFHLAAAVGVRLIVEEPVQTLVTNIQGTENVLDHCNRFNKRVLVASTSEVYGDRQEPEALAEDGKRMYGPTTARRWAYAESKALDEFLALAYHQERGLDCVIVRLFNTVGPRQSGQYGMVIPRFVTAALAGRPIEIFGDGAQTRCFCHVQDTIRALDGLMAARGISGDIFNVGSTERIAIADLAARVLELTGSSSEVVHVPYDEVYGQGIEDMIHRQPAIEKVTAAIGWQPTRSLDEILADVLRHTRSASALAAAES
jgi:UDP-glucose 4-epimerase